MARPNAPSVRAGPVPSRPNNSSGTGALAAQVPDRARTMRRAATGLLLLMAIAFVAMRLLAGPQRVEAGWWEGESGTGLARRDYFLAHNAAAGSVWVFRDRATGGWFLQGVYG